MKTFKVDMQEGKQTVIYYNGCQMTLFGQKLTTNEALAKAYPKLFTEVKEDVIEEIIPEEKIDVVEPEFPIDTPEVVKEEKIVEDNIFTEEVVQLIEEEMRAEETVQETVQEVAPKSEKKQKKNKK